MPDIIHVDMDCFFAAVEVKDNPDLAGKPVIVGALPGTRGVVSACSYEAREYGVHSAMPISQAYKRCPHGIYIEPHGSRYSEESAAIRDIFGHFTPLVEPISVDEAFLDVSGSHRLFGNSVDIGHAIKQRIREETGLIASVGIAPSKFVAKIASDLEKPDGFVVVMEDDVLDFLEPLDVGKMWGVGKVTRKRLDTLNVHTIGDLRMFSADELESFFGAHGIHLHNLSYGIDDRPVHVTGERKSVSHEYTFDTDEGDMREVERVLLALSDKVAARLQKKSLRGRTVTLKLRDHTFKTITRARTLDSAIMSGDDIYRESLALLRHEQFQGRVRLIGVGISSFDEGEQTSLFEQESKRSEDMEHVLASIRDRFGKNAITRASLIGQKKTTGRISHRGELDVDDTPDITASTETDDSDMLPEHAHHSRNTTETKSGTRRPRRTTGRKQSPGTTPDSK